MSWENRIQIAPGGGYAYARGEFIVPGLSEDDADNLARELRVRRMPRPAERQGAQPAGPADQIARAARGTSRAGRIPIDRFKADEVDDIDDVPALVADLRASGLRAQPNHVLFADACDCCPPHPATYSGGQGNPVWANPVWANPASANPVWANPVWANPTEANLVWANPAGVNPVWANPGGESSGSLANFLATGVRRSTAIPAETPEGWLESQAKRVSGPRVVVLDTGYADKSFRPDFVPSGYQEGTEFDLPDVALDGAAGPDEYLDPVAGHGTFIAGLIERVQPGCEIEVRQIVKPEGDVTEWDLVTELTSLAGLPDGTRPDLVNLSLSGYAFDDMDALALTVAELQATGTVVVASAGNDGMCRPTYPASLPGVVSVGAIGPHGPAPFSNYGPWVRACAPGVDVVSTFFTNFDGKVTPPLGGIDPDKFVGWARWSGTSFSAPIVVGAIAGAMVAYGLDAKAAAERVLDEPGLMRIPNLGTVVNVL